MEPSLPLNKKVYFGFKILEKGTSDWMGLGICHATTIKNKNYNWSSSVGHGSYLISSQVKYNLYIVK